MANQVRRLRKQLGFTQRALAEMVGTNQQQIQRIETGKVAARLDVAARIADALRAPLRTVFPEAVQALSDISSKTNAREGAISDREFDEVSEAGLEADVCEWRFIALLRGRSEPLKFHISPSQRRRISRQMAKESWSDVFGVPFIIFDTSDSRVAINSRDLVYSHFLFDLGILEREEQEANSVLEVLLSGREEPLDFGVEPDMGNPDDEEDEGQFRWIFYEMDSGCEDHHRLRFEDEDGEEVYLRAGDIALLKVPLWVVEPEFEPEEG